MKIQIISDTHSDTRDIDIYSISKDCDVVVNAGDIANGNIAYIEEFVDKCDALGKEHVFVLGNHDFYGRDYHEMIDEIRQKHPEYNLLTAGHEVTINGKTFIGDTLFSNFALYSNHSEYGYLDTNFFMEKAEEGISDFKHIRYKGSNITAEDYINLFYKQYIWLDTYRGRDDVIVVTHFPPNIKCLAKEYAEHPYYWVLNPYFINNIDLTGFKHWICGHTHRSMITEANGCNLYINALGYPNEVTGFVENMIISV